MAFELPGLLSFAVSAATIACIYALLTLGLNVHYGYTGLLNFGHVAFFAAGAFTAAWLTVPPPGPTADYVVALSLPMPWAFPLSLLGGALVGGLLAALIGVTSVRLGSHYLAVATFALAGIVYDVSVNETWLTNGTSGLRGIPKPGYEALGPELWQVAYLLFALALLAATYLVVERLIDAPFGRLLKGIREEETAAAMLGKDTNRVKLKSFAIGGAVAGLAGAAFAHYVGVVVSLSFIALTTFLVWTALLLGGAGSNRGAILGAFLLIAFREGTRFLQNVPGTADLPIASLRYIVVGLLLILVVRYRPAGLLGDPDEIVFTEGGEES